MGSNNVYRVVITADDRQNESNSVGTFTVDVTVTPVDETPEITTTGATHATPSFAEIEYDATTADLTVADYDARDEERETITWGLGGPDAGDFTINRNSGVLSFAARPNHEDARRRQHAARQRVRNHRRRRLTPPRPGTSGSTPSPSPSPTSTRRPRLPIRRATGATRRSNTTPAPRRPTSPASRPSARATKRCRTSPGISPGRMRATSPSRRTPTPGME